MILNENDSKRLLEKILSYSKAEAVTAVIYGQNTYNIRFALNSASTNGFADGLSLSITSDFGKRSGSVSLNKFDDESVKAAVAKSEEAAKRSPEGKEHMPPLEPQVYGGSANYSEFTEQHTAEARAAIVSNVIEQSSGSGVNAAGYLEDDTSFTAMMNSKGLFAYNKGTLSSFSSTIRNELYETPLGNEIMFSNLCFCLSFTPT